jgi:hypothetical protein
LVITFCLLTLTSNSRSAELVRSQQMTADEETIWKLERAYWRYVENNDLPAYSDLWHENFLGWPSVSARPVHKDHITDWITSETSKALTIKVDEFKPAAIQVTGDVASACYWITFRWQDKEAREPRIPFVSHTPGSAPGRTGTSSVECRCPSRSHRRSRSRWKGLTMRFGQRGPACAQVFDDCDSR